MSPAFFAECTARMVRKLARVGVDDVSAGFFFPLPNTEITRELEKEGKVQMTDAFLKLPVYVHNKYMAAERNYCRKLTAKQMTRWKYWIVANFYLTSFFTRPLRVRPALRSRSVMQYIEESLSSPLRATRLRSGAPQSRVIHG